MSLDLKSEDIMFQVREKLNRDKIKLWLEPYYKTSIGVGEEQVLALEALSKQFAEDLNIDKEQCMVALRMAQNHALDRLKSNEVYKETGVACLKVKVSAEKPQIITVNILLSSTTSELIDEVSRLVGVSNDRIKLISQGKVLKPLESLASQQVRNAMQLMAVILAGNDSLQESEKRFKSLESTKQDVHLLAGRSNVNNNYYFQIENQAGQTIDLPHEERKALVTAMALHEKGRAALKKEDHSLALVLFLEADKEYSECRSELLNSVDNYALLQLDIAWCYLCLRNPAQIPDADRRLKLCQENMHKSYGSNLERLIAIKGATGNEAALFMRLHLLQGVVLFHQNQRTEAKKLFEQALMELNGLKIDDNKLCMLLELGFSNTEARLGLRATHGNIEAAEELIHRRRKERELAREKNRIQLKHERERIKLGMCADGKQFCEPNFVQQLVEMGFDRSQSIEALKMSNNVISEAINLIQDQPHLLPTCSRSPSQEAVAQLASLGYDADLARKALEKYKHVENACEFLTKLLDNQGRDLHAALATSQSTSRLIDEMLKKRKDREEEEQAFKRISEGLADEDLTDDHLDLNLDQEEQFLIEYLSLLS